MSKSIIYVDRAIYNTIGDMLKSGTKRLEAIRYVRDKFHCGLGYAKSMCDLVSYTEHLDSRLGQERSFLVTGDHTVTISDHEIVFEPTKPTEDSQVTSQEALFKFVNEVRRERERGMLSHENLRRIYLNNFPSYFGDIQHDYYSTMEVMFGKYVMNWPADRVKYLIPRKEWGIIKGYFNVMTSAEATDKKLRIIKEIRYSIMNCGLAEAKGLFELAFDHAYSSSKYAATEITMIGGKQAMIKYIDVVHE